MTISGAISAFILLVQIGYSLGQTPAGFVPRTSSPLSIRYANVDIKAGSRVPLSYTLASPSVRLPQANASHVVLLVDLDAPGGISNNSFAPLLHWLTTVPGTQTELPINQTATDATAPYIGPAPPPGTGPHRYVVLGLENPKTSFQAPAGFPEMYETVESRVMFNVEEFVQKGGFVLVGATWFTVEATNATVPPESAAAPMAVTSILGVYGLVPIMMGLAALF